jgi:hypothetical protein
MGFSFFISLLKQRSASQPARPMYIQFFKFLLADGRIKVLPDSLTEGYYNRKLLS